MADSQRVLLEKLAVRVARRTGLDLDSARAAVDEALVRRGALQSVVRAEAAAMADEFERPFKAAFRSVSDALRRACAAAAPAEAAAPLAAAARRRAAARRAAAAVPGPARGSRAVVRERGRGLRMTAHHPDLAGLDRYLDAWYELPRA